ncbi:unnamed protein product [Dovyalis caffra]|uniref:Uncharacterized protein n=1 Tax=Dovyalis caffra TaxID=77055 RepID=A0AAV1QVZ2_9ROSI|nr:unnamed protein product [Dovyalis caffra]
MCKLRNLQLLDLSSNLIEGDVPSCLANMSSLKILDLSRNQFEGDLSFLSNISQIEVVDVSHNLFQGLIPLSIFANLSKLSHLDLSYNHMLEVDTESPTWYPSFQIQHLLLAGCNLNRRSNHLIPSFLFSQYSLQTIDLSNNFLDGSFPTWMLHNVSSMLRLRSNSFVGEFPHASQNKSLTLRELDISCNLLEGPLPTTINVFLPKLYAFNASSNQFAGTLPPSLGEMQNLEHLDLSNNRFSGVIPNGLTKNSPFWYLNLSNNSLGGELLPKDCKMTELKWLLLHHNHFVGNIPSCLSNSLSLFLLDVRHNNLSGIISDEKIAFAELGALLLGVNRFGGSIPQQLCRKQKLHLLDLSNNNFSGSIPSCLSNNLSWRKKFEENSWVPIDFTTKGNSYSYQGIPLTLMTGIDLSSNQLTDAIPIQLGELLELLSLNLSHNLLTGHFPASFQNLTTLDSLDLSHNKLTGHIPPEIGQMKSLGTFNVACNDLSGRIPFGYHLSTFSDSSYVGNPKLCGEPLSKECSEDYSHDNEDDEKEESHTEEDALSEKDTLIQILASARRPRRTGEDAYYDDVMSPRKIRPFDDDKGPLVAVKPDPRVDSQATVYIANFHAAQISESERQIFQQSAGKPS